MTIKLNDEISSVHDLQALILELKDYTKWYSHDSLRRLVNPGRDSDEPILSEAAKNTLHEFTDKNLSTRSAIDQLILSLEHLAKNAPQMTITLAAPPTHGIKKQLVSWCRENLSHSVLINFEFRSGLLGGMVVQSGSHIYDWSFRRQILEAGPKFPEVLRNV